VIIVTSPFVETSPNGEEAQGMRTLVIGAALAAVVVSVTACSGASSLSAADRAVIRDADLYAIDRIEKNFHKSMSIHDVDLMMSLWAPNATFTVGPGKTATGKREIRAYWLKKSKAFQRTTHWISETPAYKVRATANGDRGTLTFECHYIDVDKKNVVVVTAADIEVAKIDGKWLITNMVPASTSLKS
jgi:ketosteroid isomerase-like protein